VAAVTTRAFAFGCAFALCLAGVPAGAADAPVREFELALSGGAVPAAQRVIRVNKGDSVRLRVSSDTAGEVHLHAYRVQAVLAPGAIAEIRFKAFASGRFAITWHAAATAAPAAAHHGPPLATLDVRPD
jgi:hypothetical protein